MNCPKCNGMLVREEFSTASYPAHEDTIRCIACGWIIYKKQEIKNELKRV